MRWTLKMICKFFGEKHDNFFIFRPFEMLCSLDVASVIAEAF